MLTVICHNAAGILKVECLCTRLEPVILISTEILLHTAVALSVLGFVIQLCCQSHWAFAVSPEDVRLLQMPYSSDCPGFQGLLECI